MKFRSRIRGLRQGRGSVYNQATGAPGITGALFVGQTLTATIGTLADVNGLPAVFPTNYNLQWKRGGVNISNATAGTYVLAAADYNQTITVTASFTDGAGFPESRTSAPTTAIGDNVAPTVTAFDVANPTNTTTATVTTFIATDVVGVTGYIITTSATPPLASDPGWTFPGPSTHVLPGYGATQLYGYAKDAAGNVSASATDTVSVTDTVSPTTPVITATAVSDTQININMVTPATDAGGVDHYLLDTSPTGQAGTWSVLELDWNAQTRPHTGLTASIQRFYRCKAVDAASNGSSFATANATTQSGGSVVAPTWGTNQLPTVSVGSGYGSLDLDTFISSNGGDASITYVTVSGALPTGITLNSNGTFTGTSTTQSSGSVTFSATNSGGTTNSSVLSWVISAVASGWTIYSNHDSETTGATPANWHTTQSTISTTRAWNGTKSIRHHIPANTNGFGIWGGGIDYPVPLVRGNELWVRFKTYFPAGFDYDVLGTSNGENLKFIRNHCKTSAGVHIGYNDFLFTNAAYPLCAFKFYSEVNGLGQWKNVGNPSTDRIAFNAWETFEIYHKFDNVKANAGGMARVLIWKNGVLLKDIVDQPTLLNATDIVDFSYIWTFWNGDGPGGHPFPQEMWMDDVYVTSQRPANQDAAGNYFIGV